MISSQAGKPSITIVQDNLLGSYMMTYGTVHIKKNTFYDITMCIKKNRKVLSCDELSKRIDTIKRVLKKEGKRVLTFTGKGLLSLILPEDFNYTGRNDLHPDEPVLKIIEGVFVEGTLGKVNLGSSHESLIKILHKEYSPDISCEFADNIQFITNRWLSGNGFSIGLGDCVIAADKAVTINESIEKCYIEAKGVETTTRNPLIREVRITAALDKARDIGLRIAKEAMITREVNEESNGVKRVNSFLDTVNSGSKGAVFNLTQISGLLGPQNLKSGRVPLVLNNGKRTLVHYPFEHIDKETEFESRGFIRHGFGEGLNPQEFYFHCMSGREGISDTACSTAKSGYIQRRIVKLCEDITVAYDGTVRDVNNRIYQTVYGEMGLDASLTVNVNGKTEVCDVGRMVDRLNLGHERSST